MYAMLSAGWAARRAAAGLAYADVAYVIECSELDSLLQRGRFALFFFLARDSNRNQSNCKEYN